MRYALTTTAVVAALLLAACSSPPKVAQKKTVDVAGQKLEFGGVYNPNDSNLSLTVNGDPVAAGNFARYTPTLRVSGKYRALEVSGDCYFGSVLSSKRGVMGIVAGAVQAGHGKSGDTCDMQVNGKVVETLFF